MDDKHIPFGHHTLHNRYCFEGVLHLDTPLRLSSGRASDETDAPLMTTRDDIPYMPGSSLRGAIRSEVERIVAAAGQAQGLRGCTLFSKDDANDACISVNRAKQQCLGEKKDEAKALAYAEEALCDVCKLFGSTVFGSRLIIEDAYPVERDRHGHKRQVRDGVGIDRDTGTASPGVKFDYQVLETGPTFVFRMQVENLTEKDKLLINLVLGLLRNGLHVGGKRAAGLGRVRLDQDWKVTGFESADALWQAVIQGQDPHQSLSWRV